MDEKEVRKHHIEQMKRTEGWKIVEDWLNLRIEQIKERLVTSKDMEMVVRNQAVVSAYRDLLRQVDSYKPNKQEDSSNG